MKRSSAAAVFFASAALTASAALAAPTLATLVTFTGTNGNAPLYGSLIADGSGNLYGTTVKGGANDYGTVFKIAAGSNTLSTLATFNKTNGCYPYAGLIADGSGNLYGTTVYGGSSYDGTVFKIAAGSNTLSTLVMFNGTSGAYPYAGLIVDSSGNLYGTTSQGGSSGNNGFGYGTVFEISAGSNKLSTLATFNNTNGAKPYAGLIFDGSGNLYGTTTSRSSSGGTVFKIAAGSNTLSTLDTAGNFGGSDSTASLFADGSGNLYGTTQKGGLFNVGTVFKLPAGGNTLSTLVTFNDTNGANPFAGLIADGSGNLYGTTAGGGSSNDGTVFKIDTDSNLFTTLYTFTGPDGQNPLSGLIADASGNLYGTTAYGTSIGDGTVFELSGTGFAVPEPTSLAPAASACLALLRRRRQA